MNVDDWETSLALSFDRRRRGVRPSAYVRRHARATLCQSQSIFWAMKWLLLVQWVVLWVSEGPSDHMSPVESQNDNSQTVNNHPIIID